MNYKIPNQTEKMKILIILVLLNITLYLDGLGQTNIRTRRSPSPDFPSVIDGNATSNAIMSRYNSYNAGANDIQNRINQVQAKLEGLKYVDKKRYDEIGDGISSFIEFLNENRLDLSNSTNKRYVNSALNDISNVIDAVFERGDEEIKYPLWLDLEDGKGKQKVLVVSLPK